MAKQLGGDTESADAREYGHAEVTLIAHDRLLEGLKNHLGAPPRLEVWMSHGDHVSKAPPDFVVTAKTERVPVAAFALDAKRWYGVQFHPEVTHTKSGQALLRRFVADICQSSAASPWRCDARACHPWPAPLGSNPTRVLDAGP